MNTIQYIDKLIIPAAFTFLPTKMLRREARAQMLAIGLQESLFKYRRQIGGPARGFWQFEQGGGVRGVLDHHATGNVARSVAIALGYTYTDCYFALADNDVLAAAFARLLLWSSPLPLPSMSDAPGGWRLYLNVWRPGKPHPDAWEANFAQAWRIVEEST